MENPFNGAPKRPGSPSPLASPVHSVQSRGGILQYCCGRCYPQRYQVRGRSFLNASTSNNNNHSNNNEGPTNNNNFTSSHTQLNLDNALNSPDNQALLLHSHDNNQIPNEAFDEAIATCNETRV